ncbi:MAG: T9SS type A sorting domain-containing protein [Paludibacter sp.]
MKQKIFTQKFKLLLVMAFAMLLGQNAWGQVVGYTLSTDGAADAGISVNYPGQGRVMNITGLTSNGYGASGQTAYGWATDWATITHGWVTSAFSTAAQIGLTGSFQMKTSTGGSTTYGPRDFIVQYSLDNSAWTTLATTVSAVPQSIVLTSLFVTYDFSLPLICENKPTVYLRWIQNSSTNINGGTIGASASGRNASLKGISVAGTALAAPSTQASNISIISVTPTTITIGCTKGNGSFDRDATGKRVIMMNTTNTFTAPVDDTNPTANATYSSGQQVVYNGAGTKVTVTVPSSSNVYWFRIYEYNQLDAVTRFKTVTASGNPKECRLEAIHSPTSTAIRLTRATLGATIVTPTTGTIAKRGVYWSTVSPVTEANGTIAQESSNAGGVFTIDVTGVDRGTTIYYKGFVENESGTMLSLESSFSNTPIFTGTGTWETTARWNVQEVPGELGDVTYGSIDDSPIIEGTCTLGVSNNVTDLTVSSGSLAINTAKSMNVVGTLTNIVGNSGILIKSAAGVANGSLIWSNGNPSGTVQMYSKASKTGTKNRWQYFGIPVSSLLAENTFGGVGERVRKYDETNVATASWVRDSQVGLFNNPDYGLWFPGDANEANGGTTTMVGSATPSLVPVDGYEVVQPNAKTYSFAGTLNHGDFSKVLAKTSGADWSGNHIIANPFTAAIDISALDWTAGANLEQVVYLYNAGSRSDWETNQQVLADGILAGQYTASTGAYAGQLGTPAQIPSMQGFLVYSNSNTTNNTLGIPYSAVVSNNSTQRAKSSTQKIGTRIDVVGTKFADRMWIFSEEGCTNKFDNGFDGFKFLGSALTPQLYAVGEDGIYQIDAVKDINNTYLGFKAGQERDLKLTFTHQNMDSKYASVFLVDLVANKTVDITASGTEYAFTTEATPTAVNRFKIITQTTAVKNPSASSQLKLVSSQSSVIISNPTAEAGSLVIYNLSGSAMQTVRFDANGIITIPISLGKGIYVAKAKTATEEVTEKLIIR